VVDECGGDRRRRRGRIVHVKVFLNVRGRDHALLAGVRKRNPA
jgi:hypothetical protein